jgi:ubiquinone/menaquinone biosynthesis C-methylase UbiE
MTSSPDSLVATIRAYDAGAVRYAEHSRDRTGLARLRDGLLTLLPPQPRILDLGSGPGHDGALLAASGASVVALDPAEGLLLEARRYPAIASRLVRGDAGNLPFATASFDGIWSCASLLHVAHADTALALAEAFRVLKPGGVAFFSMSEGNLHGPVLVSDLGLAARTYYYHEAASWAGLLAHAGFEIAAHTVNRSAGNFNPGSTGWIETFARKLLTQ